MAALGVARIILNAQPATRKLAAETAKLAANLLTEAAADNQLLLPALRLARPFLERLSERFDVRYYSFGREVTRLGIDPAHPDLPEPPRPGGPCASARGTPPGPSRSSFRR